MPRVSNSEEVLKIGRWLKRSREACHMTREELAAKVHSSYEMIRLYEEGQCVMHVDRLCQLAKVLGVDSELSFLSTNQPRK